MAPISVARGAERVLISAAARIPAALVSLRDTDAVRSKLEILAPLLEAVRFGEEEGLTPEDARGLRRMEIERALREVAHPDVECVMVGPDPAFATEARGIESFVESWTDWLSPFEHWRIKLEDVVESGDRLVTLVRQFGTPKGSTAEVENAGAAVWFMRDGRLARVEFHLDRELAMKSAGLAESAEVATENADRKRDGRS
jgi:ketosteroid isomerase-like protein